MFQSKLAWRIWSKRMRLTSGFSDTLRETSEFMLFARAPLSFSRRFAKIQ
jgi:hypothetical protein